MYMLDIWANLEQQVKDYFIALCYGVVDVCYYTDRKIDIDILDISKEHSLSRHLNKCSFTIEFAIKNIDLLASHYEGFDKAEALKTYNFILSLIESEKIELQNRRK
jgi:hypothetical protein